MDEPIRGTQPGRGQRLIPGYEPGIPGPGGSEASLFNELIDTAFNWWQ